MNCKDCDVDYPDELCIRCTEKGAHADYVDVNLKLVRSIMVRDQFGIYVIKDNGAGDASLPFFALSTQVAVRQFATAVRTCPPSMRPDMELVAIGHYDHSVFELVDAPEVSVCLGSDENIQKMVENDKKFYERVSVDQLPVEGGEK